MNHLAKWDNEHAKRLMRDDPLEPVQEFFASESIKPEGAFQKVLDVGCGAGTNTLWLVEKGFSVWAFDGSPHAIIRLLDAATAKTQKIFQKLQGCTVADVSKAWPYKNESFDIVLDVRCLENFNQAEALLAYKQVARVLRRDGWLLSITACEHRSLKATVGEARLSDYKEMTLLLTTAGLDVQDLSHWHGDGVHDLVVEAKKP